MCLGPLAKISKNSCSIIEYREISIIDERDMNRHLKVTNRIYIGVNIIVKTRRKAN